jgi:hypothetical protein
LTQEQQRLASNEHTANSERAGESTTQVTDAGLEHLKELTNLRYLHVADTQVTEAGINELTKALPYCTIRQ